MILVRNVMWRWLIFTIFLAAFGVVLCAVLLLKLGAANHELQAQSDANQALIAVNSDLISQLQRRDDALAAAAADARRRESALRLLVRGLQQQVDGLGGTPLQLPPELRNEPAFPGSTDESGARPSSSAGPPAAAGSPRPTSPSRSPVPRTSPSARPSARPSPTVRPSPSSSPTCLVPVGQLCLARSNQRGV